MPIVISKYLSLEKRSIEINIAELEIEITKAEKVGNQAKSTKLLRSSTKEKEI